MQQIYHVWKYRKCCWNANDHQLFLHRLDEATGKCWTNYASNSNNSNASMESMFLGSILRVRHFFTGVNKQTGPFFKRKLKFEGFFGIKKAIDNFISLTSESKKNLKSKYSQKEANKSQVAVSHLFSSICVVKKTTHKPIWFKSVALVLYCINLRYVTRHIGYGTLAPDRIKSVKRMDFITSFICRNLTSGCNQRNECVYSRVLGIFIYI